MVDGRVVACRYVRLACQRHLDDLENGHRRGLRFDEADADFAINFFSVLKHSKGKWAGKSFELTPWQQFAVGSMFGWKRADGFRRFRLAHIEVARKNGKSTLAAGLGLLLFLFDGEPGAEVYTVATKRDQARITHDESKQMAKLSRSISQKCVIYRDNIHDAKTRSKFEPLGADGDSLDGLNVHGWIADELHAWKNRLLWDVMETATGAREQPLGIATTTAGYDRQSIWWERRETCIRALEARNADDAGHDDSLFALIYTLDDQDDWTDENVWIKANPNLGVTVKVDEIREKCKQAKSTPGKQNAFRRLRLNQPTEQANRWLDMQVWDRCATPFDEDTLAGRTCFGGLDLSATTDLSAFSLIFPPIEDDPLWRLLVRIWTPAETMAVRAERDGAPYPRWADNGLIEATPGNVIDYDAIKAKVIEDAAKFRIKKVAFDRWNAMAVVLELQNEGVEMIGFGQGFGSMSAPTKRFSELLLDAKLIVGDSPAMRWQAQNVAVQQNAAGDMKPNKAKSTGRIDGMVSSIMALGLAIAEPAEQDGGGFEAW